MFKTLRRVSALSVFFGLGAACSSGSDSASDQDPAQPRGGASEQDGMQAGGSGDEGAEDLEASAADQEGSAGTSTEVLDPTAIGNVEPGSDSSGAEPAPAASGGCGQSSMLASGNQSLEVGGVMRTYVLDIPPDYDGATAYPIVFAFHGATTSGQFFRSAFYGNLLSAMGDEAIVVHPDALGTPTVWSSQADLPFFDSLLAELTSELCVDEDRVFATGHSSGGFFTNTLGCQRGDVLRGIAPVSGGGRFNRNGCVGQVAAWLAHGENDETVPIVNGERSRDDLLAANGCDAEPEPVSPEPCLEYAGCDGGFAVRWCVYQDGHNWPDFAPQGIWSFFSAL